MMMPRFRSMAFVAAIASSMIARPAVAQEFDTDKLYLKVVKSAVMIVSPSKGGFGTGSGSLIDVEKRLVLTNFHVIDGSDTCYVQFPMFEKDGVTVIGNKAKYMERIPEGLAITGKVIQKDKTRDLAIVQLERVPPGQPAIPLARKSITPGTTTWNIGSPGKVPHLFSITRGEARTVGNTKFDVGGGGEVLKISAKVVTSTNPVNPGDSGGPLFDKNGYQIAVTQSGIFSAAVQNVNTFIDVMEVRAFLEERKIYIKELLNPDNTPIKEESKLVTPKEGPKPKDEPKKEVPMVKGTTPKADAPSSDQESKAAGDLKRAKIYADGDENRPTYKARLQEVIKKYPGTAAASEAKRLLDGLGK